MIRLGASSHQLKVGSKTYTFPEEEGIPPQDGCIHGCLSFQPASVHPTDVRLDSLRNCMSHILTTNLFSGCPTGPLSAEPDWHSKARSHHAGFQWTLSSGRMGRSLCSREDQHREDATLLRFQNILDVRAGTGGLVDIRVIAQIR